MPSPTVDPPRSTNLSAALTRNIATLQARQQDDANARQWDERFADAITRFAGSMVFVYLHAAIYGAWVIVNLGLIPFLPPFDKSFVILATEASVEAIFLSTFVLISQNKMAAGADKRASLDLQINLLTEHEVTKVAAMLAIVMERLDIPAYQDRELDEVTRDVAPEAVLDALERKTPDGPDA